MARIEVVMPKMGESIMEGTIVEWSKKVGDHVELDETLLEIATDKVDSEVPAPEAGVLVEILAEEGETVEVGVPIAIIETEPEAAKGAQSEQKASDSKKPEKKEKTADIEQEVSSSAPETTRDTKPQQSSADSVAAEAEDTTAEPASTGSRGSSDEEAPQLRKTGSDGRFYSPLVRSIAHEEGISQKELETITGSGSQGRVTKQDILDYVASGKKETKKDPVVLPSYDSTSRPQQNVEIIKMDRMRKLISEHMTRSLQTSAHVTTFGEADVTRLVRFRDKHKDRFLRDHGFKLTFTPFFVEATIQAIREFPLLNSSVEGDNILLKRDINYGIAVSLGESGTGGLVVPVIKNAGEMNLQGLARMIHQLAGKARSKTLSPDDLFGGTFTLTNYGSVGNLMGTPIINQPQVAIFGTGIIQKRPVVMEVEGNDTIAIRHMVYLSMSYDHRIIDGAMGGAFVQRVKELLENFDTTRGI